MGFRPIRSASTPHSMFPMVWPTKKTAVMMEVFSFVMGAAFLKLQARRTLSKGWRCSDMVGRPGMISV